MYLAELTVKNFRSFDETKIALCPDLTVFVGENNGGKSNAIDAIRLLTPPLSGRRDLYCETTDIRFGSMGRRFDLRADYEDLTPSQQGRFISAATDDTLQRAAFGLTYDEGSPTHPDRPSYWAGQFKGPPEPGCRQMIRHVYLPPLRDARRELASANPTRIYALLQHFLGEEDPEVVARSVARQTSAEILSRIGRAVDGHLTQLTEGVRRQQTRLGFATEERLIQIARDLRFRLADHGIEPEDLQYSGHGYANLLYISAISVELEKVNSADLTLFLVEEPEAHLHPQLQAAVLSFLEQEAERSRATHPDKVAPAGEIQVVVATHSPNLSAWSEGRKLVVFRSISEPMPTLPRESSESSESISDLSQTADDGSDQGSCGPTGRGVDDPRLELADGETASARAKQTVRRVSHCVALGSLDIDPLAWRKIDRYLDVTKSALLFGGRVLLVEGVAETLLLPTIARRHLLRDRPAALRRFHSAVLVAIEGVDLEPYVRLLLAGEPNVRVAERVVVMTDGDAREVALGGASPGERREQELHTIAKGLGAEDILRTSVSNHTLEADLVQEGNAAIMKRAYLRLHPRSEAKWEQAVEVNGGTEQAMAIADLFQTVRKGDFAHLLAEEINDSPPESMHVPPYITRAIDELVA